MTLLVYHQKLQLNHPHTVIKHQKNQHGGLNHEK